MYPETFAMLACLAMLLLIVGGILLFMFLVEKVSCALNAVADQAITGGY